MRTARRAARSCTAVAVGALAASSAATPLTCGAAIDVPLAQEKLPFSPVDSTFAPGAKRSTAVALTFEKSAGSSAFVLAPTQTTFAAVELHGMYWAASALSLPADTT